MFQRLQFVTRRSGLDDVWTAHVTNCFDLVMDSLIVMMDMMRLGVSFFEKFV